MLKCRLAGIFWLVTIAASFGASAIARPDLFLSGHAAATAQHVLASSLYRAGIATDLVALAAYLVVTVLLYDLLRSVDRTLSLLAATFSLVGLAVGAAGELGYIVPLLVLDGSASPSVWRAEQSNAVTYLAIQLYGQAFNLTLLFFGVQLLLLAYLVARSALLPRAIAVLIALGGAALLGDSLATILAPSLERAISAPVLVVDLIAEGVFALWLIARGLRFPDVASNMLERTVENTPRRSAIP